ncbi:hypothetical protein DW1_2414 [Proteiniborus sp. DW1]|uniref:transposase n=1 Tax=Proteiniborus sp. DW1 TaxID=1889883 RepID=UPI00092DF195|nr:transposase [Proteiniborus sp. DW1]SCG83978.1 hypothetical protein DW1_2414 [Proteiniborus sp. DW1]
MVRVARKESPTGYYHVMMRGNNKEMIFAKVAEKKYFIEQLQEQVEKKNISIVAYCLMNNHVHLLIHSELPKMTDAFKRINIKFAGLYNSKYERVGHVFQDRFKSEVIDSEGYLIRAMRYIHNNPVKAKIAINTDDYYWSSYKEYIEGKNKLVCPREREFILGLFSYSIEYFKSFHLEEEIEEFLEISEDLEQEREERAQKIIDKFLKKYDIRDIKALTNDKNILEDTVKQLLKNSYLSHRRIAELLHVSRGTIHGIAKKLD